MALCGSCKQDAGDNPLECSQCGDPSCGSDGCGFWCDDCGDWICSDEDMSYNDDGNPICMDCDEDNDNDNDNEDEDD